ncbi:hypothetical protein FRX31_018856 [Thalictrum thalictroides]|uniref:Reverse transcriptase zinc-binding domain-containing protein n=1 Tax=Thalictrum thalictroides TaxID=46969 RepID=A0A7J6W5E6_THATH|nr:hypothetical protein FRX31_018856 [Thalictrum thalictroides]
MNVTLLGSWLWRFNEGPDCLWKKVVRYKYGMTEQYGVENFPEEVENFPEEVVWKSIQVFMWCLVWGRTLTTDRLRRLGLQMERSKQHV